MYLAEAVGKPLLADGDSLRDDGGGGQKGAPPATPTFSLKGRGGGCCSARRLLLPRQTSLHRVGGVRGQWMGGASFVDVKCVHGRLTRSGDRYQVGTYTGP